MWEELGAWDWHIYTIDTMYKIDRGFPGGSVVKNPPANAGDAGLIPGFGRSPELVIHSSILAWEIPQTEEAWWVTVHDVAKESDMTKQLNNNNNSIK